MAWRILGTIAERVGLDPERLTNGADSLLAGAQRVANAAVEHGAPVVKRAATQMRSAGQGLVDDLAKAAKSRAAGKPVALPPADAPPVAKVPAKRKPPAAPAAPGETPISVQVKAKTELDITGLSITADDARELARRPEGFADLVLDGAESRVVGTAEQAEAVRDYVASTPLGIFESHARVERNAEQLRQRGALQDFGSLWEPLRAAPLFLRSYDQANGTDYAASSWLAMLRGWETAEIPPANVHAAEAVRIAFRIAAESPRAHVHVADVCERLLAMHHVVGWPSVLFRDSGDVDALMTMLRSTVGHPELGPNAAKAVFSIAGAMMMSPVSDAERALGRVTPEALRADVGMAACDILDGLGSTTHQGLRAAAEAASKSPDANLSAVEARELERLPRWFMATDLTFSNNSQRYAHAAMSEGQANELASYVGATTGDLDGIGRRLQGLWRSPRVCAELAERLGVTADSPKDGAHQRGLVSDGVHLTENLARGLRMLATYDAGHGSRYAVDATRGLLEHAKLGPDCRALVDVAREVFASPSATADDQLFFLARTGSLIERSAWPAVDGDSRMYMSNIIAGVAERVAGDDEAAKNLFITGFKLTSTDTHDDARGRASIAASLARLATTLGRETDASIFTSIEKKLRPPLGD